MDLHTPLLDLFRRDEVAHDVRLLAAKGAFAPRPLEQLALLMFLTFDRDAEIQQTAEATLSRIPEDLIAAFIARSDVPGELRQFFVQRGVTPAAMPLEKADEALVDEDETDYGAESATDAERASILERLAKMNVPEKVKAAMKGTREMRAVLVRDANKMVSLAVLSSPKLTDTEVEAIARMGSVAEDVLRAISRTRAWMKSYAVVLALVKNSKTPVAITIPLLSRVHEGDLKRVSIDRNVPEPLRLAARRRMVMAEK
jgi:hypothetical protein